MSNAKTDGKNRSKTAGAAALLVGTLGGLWALGGALGLGGFLGLGGVTVVTMAGSGCGDERPVGSPDEPDAQDDTHEDTQEDVKDPLPPAAEVLWRYDYDEGEDANWSNWPMVVTGDFAVYKDRLYLVTCLYEGPQDERDCADCYEEPEWGRPCRIRAHSLDDGHALWDPPPTAPSTWRNGIVVTADGGFYILGVGRDGYIYPTLSVTHPSRVHRYAPDGTLIWQGPQAPDDWDILHSPSCEAQGFSLTGALDPDENLYFAAGPWLVSIDLNGHLRWKVKVGPESKDDDGPYHRDVLTLGFRVPWAPIVAFGHVITVTPNNGIQRFTFDGELVDQHPALTTPGWPLDWGRTIGWGCLHDTKKGPIAGPDGTLYMGNQWAFDLTTGETKWFIDGYTHPPSSWCSTVTADGEVFAFGIESVKDGAYRLELHSQNDHFTLGQSTPPVIGVDGRLVVIDRARRGPLYGPVTLNDELYVLNRDGDVLLYQSLPTRSTFLEPYSGHQPIVPRAGVACYGAKDALICLKDDAIPAPDTSTWFRPTGDFGNTNTMPPQGNY